MVKLHTYTDAYSTTALIAAIATYIHLEYYIIL